MSNTENPESQPKKKRFVLPIDAMDRSKLHNIYMPFITGVALFFPTARPFDLGDEVNILLNLIDEPDKILLEGRVVWLTPKQSEGGYAAGIGVKLEGENASHVRSKIDNILAGTLTSGPNTQTM